MVSGKILEQTNKQDTAREENESQQQINQKDNYNLFFYFDNPLLFCFSSALIKELRNQIGNPQI
jgi:hypothetical protein